MSFHDMAAATGSPGAYRNGITEWPTPQWLVDQLAAEFAPGGFDLDPAADASIAKAPRYFTAVDDGLALPWHARAVWLNPSYGKTWTPQWLAKAKAEVDCGNAGLVICLVPARVETAWWREYEADPAVFTRVIGRIRWSADRRAKRRSPQPSSSLGASRAATAAIRRCVPTQPACCPTAGSGRPSGIGGQAPTAAARRCGGHGPGAESVTSAAPACSPPRGRPGARSVGGERR
jgi:phage N-6-adenine-methyltransferase